MRVRALNRALLARRVRELELRDKYRLPADVKPDVDHWLLVIARAGGSVNRLINYSDRANNKERLRDAQAALAEILQHVEMRGWTLGSEFASYKP